MTAPLDMALPHESPAVSGSDQRLVSAPQIEDDVVRGAVESSEPPDARSQPERPVLIYHGGKWILGPWIISHFPEHRVYVEPFGGAASVLLQKPRSYAEIYNDLDTELVNLFMVVRSFGDDLHRQLELTPFSRDEYKQSFEVSYDPIEQARRTVIRSMMGFGSNALCREIKSGFRSNSNRSGTTPAHDWRNYPKSLVAIIERLRGVVIENRNAAEIMVRHDSAETLHYCDPPYVHDTRSSKVHRHHGYSHEMTDEQHRDFARIVRNLKGMVIISGYHGGLYDELFGDWRIVERKAFADGARERVEVLWFSPNVHPHEDLFKTQRSGAVIRLAADKRSSGLRGANSEISGAPPAAS